MSTSSHRASTGAAAARPRGLAVSAAIALSILVSHGPVRAADVVHVVQRGQTIVQIARRYRVSVHAVLEANNLRKWQQIHPGLSLVIPAQGERGQAPVRGRTADRQTGDRAGARGHRGESSRQEPKDKPGRVAVRSRPGFVHLIRGSERFDGQFLTRRGRLAPSALAGLARVLRYSPTGASTPIDARLAALIGDVSNHFGGRPIHIVSGYRPYSPAQYTAHSNHNLGRAMDFNIEGISNATVRDYCRTFQNAGVGYYPNSSFVHLDVRSGKAFWIDYSGPGEAPHYQSDQANPGEAPREVEPHSGVEDGADTPSMGSEKSPETP